MPKWNIQVHLKRLVGRRSAAEIEGLPGYEVGQERHAVRFALVGGRVHRVGAGRSHHHVDLLVEDQVGRDLGHPVGAGLGVELDDVDGMLLAVAADDAVTDSLEDIGHDPFVRTAERGDGPGDRRDGADLDLAAHLGLSRHAGRGLGHAGGRGLSHAGGRGGRCRGGSSGLFRASAGGQQAAKTAGRADGRAGDTGDLEELAAADRLVALLKF